MGNQRNIIKVILLLQTLVLLAGIALLAISVRNQRSETRLLIGRLREAIARAFGDQSLANINDEKGLINAVGVVAKDYALTNKCLNISPYPVALMDGQGKIQRVNPALETDLGIAQEAGNWNGLTWDFLSKTYGIDGDTDLRNIPSNYVTQGRLSISREKNRDY